MRLPNWLGDTVMAVPAIRALRDAFHTATLLAAGPWASILDGQGLADVLVTYPRQWSGRLHAANTVRVFSPELAVVLPNSLESAAAARCWGATRRVGYAVGGRCWLLTDGPRLPSPRRHQVDEYAALVEALDLAVVSREPNLAPPRAEERGGARTLLSQIGASRRRGAPLVGVHLGAAYGSSKLWPPGHVVSLVQALARDGATAVLMGPPACADVEREVTAAVTVPSLVGRDGPRLLPALLTEIDVLVGGDTGVTHLAAALGIPVVTLFGPTDPELTAPRGRVEIVTRGVPCAPCFYRECPIDHPCMRGIGAGEVAARVWSLLGTRTGT
ncbi:MAG: glycosyltransferase family 9 protein [Candidatus Rokubacteria bacterium]|nr:glycosyltransferase family 9 protein [Candidatus Rokubacteria bacterium]